MDWRYPADIIVVRRNELLRYIFTINPKKNLDPLITCYIDMIKSKFPVVDTIENMFKEFHAVIMGKEPDAIYGYLERYQGSKIAGFCDGIKNDINSIRNAISLDISSGFVEGNNNKFKMLKRVLYGRTGLVNLEKRCKFAFEAKTPEFNLNLL